MKVRETVGIEISVSDTEVRIDRIDIEYASNEDADAVKERGRDREGSYARGWDRIWGDKIRKNPDDDQIVN